MTTFAGAPRIILFLLCMGLPLLAWSQDPQPLTRADADELLQQGRVAYSQQGPEAALPLWQQALAAYRKLGDQLNESITLGYLGNCQKRLGNYDRALELLGQALAMKRGLEVSVEVGKTLNHLGLVYWEMGSYAQAVEHFEESLAIARKAEHQQLQAALINNLALINDERGAYRASLERYQQALALEREIGDRESQGATLGNIGGVHYLLGDFRQAIEYYEKALAISRELELKPAQSQDLGNLALCHLWLDESAKALRLLDQALELAREAGLKKEEADWLKFRGSTLVRRGNYSEALASYRTALEIYEKAEMKRELVDALEDLADVYLPMGETLSSRRELERALALAEAIGYKRGSIRGLIRLGDLEQRLGQTQAALGHYTGALELAKELEDRTQQTLLLIRLARLRSEQGKYKEAGKGIQRALELARKQGMRAFEALALLGQAELMRRQAKLEPALPLYKQGLELALALENPELTWRLFHGQGRTLEALDKQEEAVTAYRSAVEQIEAVRSRLRDEIFRAGYMEDKSQVYVDLVRLLLELGRVKGAFSYVERSRARAYLDLMGSERAGAWLARSSASHREERALRKKIHRLNELLEEQNEKPRSERRNTAVTSFTRELSDTERRYSLLLAELRGADPEYASLMAVSPLQVEDLQPLLAADEALLEYFFAGERLSLFVVTPERIAHFARPVGEGELGAKVELLRDRLKPEVSGHDDWRGPAESLYEHLIAPAEAGGLLEGVQGLYLAPQGVLHYLPFAALPRPEAAGGGYLLERFHLAYLPSASTLDLCRAKQRPGHSRLLALAPGGTGLRYASEEVRAVHTLFAAEGLALTGSRASEHAYKSRCADYAMLHFATHGELNKLNPLFSHVHLEADGQEDGRLEVHEIMGLTLNADLVTLSACNTALGSGYFSEIPAGDDWVGLTRAFMYAGTPSVVASLWEVDDRSTTALMKKFYGYLRHTDKARALARAQRDLLASDSEAHLSHPYHWAGFVLVGDAR